MRKRKTQAPPKRSASRSPTMREVANAAGVGIATVSRVLNNSPLVVPETAEQVRKIMQDMQYNVRPREKRAKGPKTSGAFMKHRAVCVLCLEHLTLRWVTDNAPVYAYAIHGAEAALNRLGLNCIIRHLSSPADASQLRQMDVDGFVILGNELGTWTDELKHYACVKMLGSPSRDWCDRVTYDGDTVGQLAAEYLGERGIRNTATIGVSTGNVFTRRVLSFTCAMNALGGKVKNLTHDQLLPNGKESNMPSQEIVGTLVDKLVQSSPKIEGLFVTSDVMVPPVYMELQRHGIQPGKDITIVSCNNERSYLQSLNPQPAVIDIRSEIIGSQAVERLIWRIEHPDAPRATLMLEPALLPAATI